MERKPVESSNIASVGFCPDSKCVEIEYRNGSIYQYEDCDQKLFDDLMASKSKGKFANANLKPRKFKKLK